MGAADLVWAITAGGCGLAATHRWRTALRHRTKLDQVAMSAGITFLSLGFSIQISSVHAAIDHVGRRAELGQHLSQLLVIAAAFCAQIFLIMISRNREASRRMVRRRIEIFAVTLTVLIAAFVTATPTEPALAHQALSARGPGLVYLAVYTTYIAWSSADTTRLAWHYARWTDQDYLRLGLHLIATAGTVSLAYVPAKITFTVLRTYAFHRLTPVENATVRPLMATAGLLFAAGIAIPAWGRHLPGLGRLIRWRARHRCYRLIHPLWAALTTANPDIRLQRFHTRLRNRLYRRVIETNDGLLALRPYRDPRIADLAAAHAHDITDDTALEAITEAATIAAALRAKARGEPPPATAAPTITPGVDAEDDLDREAYRLQLVAVAFTHSPTVAATLADADRLPPLTTQPPPARADTSRQPHGQDRSEPPT